MLLLLLCRCDVVDFRAAAVFVAALSNSVQNFPPSSPLFSFSLHLVLQLHPAKSHSRSLWMLTEFDQLHKWHTHRQSEVEEEALEIGLETGEIEIEKGTEEGFAKGTCVCTCTGWPKSRLLLNSILRVDVWCQLTK